MDCKNCREALSARLDNEEEFASSVEVDDHLRKCPACRRWQVEAAALTRALRVRPAVKTPDLVAEVLGAVQAIPVRGNADEGQTWPRGGA
ncbi:MAG: zf-HC2 domain-containing protein [Mycobacterium sp.]|uniref:zf-HC2 domain-containing protein n=1 Tax=Mycobacterium sp. TaxID=1785 RepID=UPI00263394DD|nr:zf-HC2 domain-containing protein [Mycobacterium sp.]MDI3313543.1 zf-HC2 domain-containing protein [Mycobacterium sp.]